MTAALLWTLGTVVFAAEIAIVYFIARDGGDEVEGDERLAQPLNLPPARDDLAEPWPVRQTPTDLAAAYVDAPPYPWTLLPLERGLLDRVHLYADLGVYPVEPVTIGERARQRAAGPITQEFAAIVGVELHQLGSGAHRERRAAA